MSKLFFDHLVVLDEVEAFIRKNTKTNEEKEELWGIIDEIVHHKVLDLILGKLPKNLHGDFLKKFHSHPHDEDIIKYLQEKITENVEELIRQEIGSLASSLLDEIGGKKK